MKKLISGLLLAGATLLAGCSGDEQASSSGSGAEADSNAEQMQSFKPPEEMVAGWYHRHELENWAAKGARKDVVEAVLIRIAQASGVRADERWIDSISEYGPGNWVYEWAQVGEAALMRAQTDQAQVNPEETEATLREALAYFTIASWPHLGNDDDRNALARARVVYLALGAQLPVPVSHQIFAVGDSTSAGYLHVPPGEGPFPVVLLTYGSDVTKEDGLDFFRLELARRGIALFSVDMPGIGEGAHLSLLDGSDQILRGARAHLQKQTMINEDLIYVVGASFGGNAAARAFLTMDGLAGVVSMCGPLHSAFMAPPQGFDALPALTIDGVKARIGLKGQSSEALAEVAPRLSLQQQGLFEGPPIETPLFVFVTNQDPVAPLDDLGGLLGRAEDVDTLIIDQVGHCPARTVRQPVVARWVSDRIQERISTLEY